MTARPTVLIADDHSLLIRAVADMLSREFDIVGSVSDGEALVESATRLCPDILIVDIVMPGLTGLQALKLLTSEGCTATAVMLTACEDPSMVEAALAAGARGYVTKGRIAPDLVPAIRAALAGRTFVSPLGA